MFLICGLTEGSVSPRVKVKHHPSMDDDEDSCTTDSLHSANVSRTPARDQVLLIYINDQSYVYFRKRVVTNEND
jgi:hypothetical protein